MAVQQLFYKRGSFNFTHHDILPANFDSSMLYFCQK